MRVQKFLHKRTPIFYLKLASFRMSYYMFIGRKKKAISIITEHLIWNKK